MKQLICIRLFVLAYFIFEILIRFFIVNRVPMFFLNTNFHFLISFFLTNFLKGFNFFSIIEEDEV